MTLQLLRANHNASSVQLQFAPVLSGVSFSKMHRGSLKPKQATRVSPLRSMTWFPKTVTFQLQCETAVYSGTAQQETTALPFTPGPHGHKTLSSLSLPQSNRQCHFAQHRAVQARSCSPILWAVTDTPLFKRKLFLHHFVYNQFYRHMWSQSCAAYSTNHALAKPPAHALPHKSSGA